MATWGVVPARGGSKGVPGKNLRKIAGKTLVERAVLIGLEAGLDGVLVSTDDEAIAESAVSAGAIYLGQRPATISSDSAHMFPTYKHALQQLTRSGHEPDAIVALLPTNPFRSVESVQRTVKLLDNHDWVFSVSEMEHHPYRAMRLIDETRCVPNYQIPAHVMWANRQELPSMFRFNGVTIAGRARNIARNDEYDIDGIGTFDTKVAYVLTSQLEAFDIDSELDLEVAQLLWSARLKG